MKIMKNREVNERATIYTATGILQAVVVQNILERTGIPVKLEYQTYNDLPDALSVLAGEIKLTVPVHHEQEALSLVNLHCPVGEIFGLLFQA